MSLRHKGKNQMMLNIVNENIREFPFKYFCDSLKIK